jgi:hypothetical protein
MTFTYLQAILKYKSLEIIITLMNASRHRSIALGQIF